MRIPCPVCSTVIKAAEKHIGLKNRCIECQTKFIIPASPDDEIEILERGEVPQPEKPTAPLLKTAAPKPPAVPITPPPRTSTPKKLITSSEPLGKGVRTNVPSRRVMGRPIQPAGASPRIPLRKEAPSPTARANRKTIRHNLEHSPAVDPPKTEKPSAPTAPEADATATVDAVAARPEAPPRKQREPIAPATAKAQEDPPATETLETKPGQSAVPQSEPVAERTGQMERTKPVLQTGPTRAGRPVAATGARGSYHDLKVNRTQRNAKGIGPAIAVVGLCIIVSLILLSNMGGGDDRKELANTNVNAIEEPPLIVPGPVGPQSEPEEPGVAEITLAGNHWDDVIFPMIEHYCLDCHDEANEEGGLEMERFSSEKLALMDPRIWEKAAALVKMKSMPPRDRFNLPTDEERQQFIAWVDTVGERWDAGEFGQNPGRTTIRRLTKNEFNYTIRDLFGLKIRPADNFPEDGGGEDGFDNNADALFLPPLLMENIVESAGLIVNAIYRDQATYRRYLFAFPHSADGLDEAARKILDYWAPLIYRRPVEAAEINKLVGLVRFQVSKKKKDYREAMKMPLLAMLISPHFLYRSETIKPGGKAYRVEEIDLASRLSYFLWSSTPDAELLKLATEGNLGKPEIYEAQVKRMLMDKRANSLGMHFAGQWLKWEELRSRANPDKRRFSNFDFALRVSMYRESSLFFDNLVKENLPLLDLIDSDYSFLNQRLAIHYNVPGVTIAGFQKVLLDDPNRGGVIGMGSVLTVTSLPLRSSPAVRGNYVLTELLGTPPPAPPMNVPQLPDDDEELEFTSFRNALIKHREDPNCYPCHVEIDQLGFGLENYDAIGRWREFQNDQPVDSKGVLPDGSKFSNPKELKGILMSRRDQFARNVVEKALSYALGRELTPYDRPTVRNITDKLIADGYRTQTLFIEVARSYPFLNCRGDDFIQY